MQEGDRIVQIDDTANPTWEDIAIKEVANAGRPLSVWIVRDGDESCYSDSHPRSENRSWIRGLGRAE